MGISKALKYATAFCLALSGSALAADLLPPPPPPPAPVVYDQPDYSGWYLRGDVGVGINHQLLRTTFDDPTFNAAAAGVGTDTSSIGDSTFLRLGVGYQVNSWFRADVTGEYRSQAALNNVESYTNNLLPAPATTGYCGPVAPAAGAVGRCFDTYTSNVQSTVFLANGYADLGTWYNLTPYIGVGIGTSYNRLGSITDQGVNGGFGLSRASSKFTPAWALMTGIAYSVTPNLKLEFGYRYLNMGQMSSNPIVCNQTTGCHYEVHKYKLFSNDFHIGMRWLLGANGEGNGQAMYWGHNAATSGTLVSSGYGAAPTYDANAEEGTPITKRY